MFGIFMVTVLIFTVLLAVATSVTLKGIRPKRPWHRQMLLLCFLALISWGVTLGSAWFGKLEHDRRVRALRDRYSDNQWKSMAEYERAEALEPAYDRAYRQLQLWRAFVLLFGWTLLPAAVIPLTLIISKLRKGR